MTAGADHYDVFEQMHYVCFHYEFEHDPSDVDEECNAGGCPSRRVGLRESMKSWTDWDHAAFALGRTIGMFERPDDFLAAKGVFWSDNPTGSGLHDALEALAAVGIVERRDEPDIQFRWPSL